VAYQPPTSGSQALPQRGSGSIIGMEEELCESLQPATPLKKMIFRIFLLRQQSTSAQFFMKFQSRLRLI
jgi:hypothetical protein